MRCLLRMLSYAELVVSLHSGLDFVTSRAASLAFVIRRGLWSESYAGQGWLQTLAVIRRVRTDRHTQTEGPGLSYALSGPSVYTQGQAGLCHTQGFQLDPGSTVIRSLATVSHTYAGSASSYAGSMAGPSYAGSIIRGVKSESSRSSYAALFVGSYAVLATS